MASSSDKPAPKRPKLDVAALCRGKRITTAGKAALLTELKQLQFLPEDQATSNRTLHRARTELASRTTLYGPVVCNRTFTTADGPVDFPVQNPLAILQIAIGESARYANYVRNAIDVHGLPSHSNTWHIVLYVDEVTCGNPLAVRSDARRKVQGLYWALYELGEQALADDSCWFELMAFRTSETIKFVGGVSHLMDVALTCFFDPCGHNIRHGLRFQLMGYGTIHLCVRLELFIADIPAICQATGANGPSADVPCFLCRRILSYTAARKPEIAALPGFVTLSCDDQTQWGKHTNTSLRNLLAELRDAAANLPPKELKQKQTLCGFKHRPSNFLLNENAVPNPLDIIMVDWMHLMFQTGNWNRETFRVLECATTRSFNAYELMSTYIKAFSFPRGHSVGNLLKADHWKSCKEAEVFKATASDGLILYAVVCKFFNDVLLPKLAGTACHADLAARVASYTSLCDVIDLLQMCKHGHQIEPTLLEAKLADWIANHRVAYGVTLQYLKTHLTGHLADMLRKRIKPPRTLALLIACWALDSDCMYTCMQTIKSQSVWNHERSNQHCTIIVHAYIHTLERHHKIIRSHVVDRLNQQSFEKGLAEELAVHTLHDLKSQPVRDGFCEPHAAPKSMVATLVQALECSGQDVQTCVKARAGPCTFHRGDVVVYRLNGAICAGDINFFASSREWGQCAFISAWDLVHTECTPGAWKYNVNACDLVRVDVCSLVATVTAHIGTATATVICPPFLNFM